MVSIMNQYEPITNGNYQTAFENKPNLFGGRSILEVLTNPALWEDCRWATPKQMQELNTLKYEENFPGNAVVFGWITIDVGE